MDDKLDKELSTLAPQMGITDFKGHIDNMMTLVRGGMREGKDFGVIPGTGKKTLFDPGAEKLANYFGLTPTYTLVKEIEDFEKGLFYYKYKCSLTHFKTGKPAGEAERSCNSFEPKYLYKWVNKQRIKRTPGELVEGINTYMSMAQKRAFVEAVKTATMASEIFETDGRDKKDPPKAPTSNQMDQGRVNLMKKFFVVARDRGFPAEAAKENIHKKFGVDTMEKISNEQISQTIENLETKYMPVEVGEAPRLVGSPTPPPQVTAPPKVEEAEIVDEDEEDEKEMQCYVCKKPIPEPYNGYYCSKECNDKYIAEHRPQNKVTQFMDAISSDKEKKHGPLL